MVYILLAVHIFFTFKLKFVQKHTFKGIKYSFKNNDSKGGIGTYKAFAAALGTTVGPGNIVGVAVAISLGGSGSVFWLWVCGILAMATKYAESYLCIKYKKSVGGTMALLCHLNHKKLAILWSVLCGVGGLMMGASIPSNSLATSFPAERWITGVVLGFMVALTISFGFKGIANVSGLLVPVMSVGFTVFCGLVILKNAQFLPEIFADMIKNAFSFSAVAGGGIGVALKQGITRGLYSNESGLGTGGLLAAESGDSNIELCSLSAMTTAFWDTVVMCSVTGVMFLSCGAKKGMNVETILDMAFSSFKTGKAFLGLSMTLFVFATVIGWYYIAKKALDFFFDTTTFYDVIYVSAVFFGAIVSLERLWKMADVINLMMLLPSLYAFLRLSGKINLYIKNK